MPDTSLTPDQLAVIEDAREFATLFGNGKVHRLVGIIADLDKRLTAERARVIRFHAQVCSPDNCVLDGGPEHEKAFR